MRFSVVIPTLDEADRIGDVIAATRTLGDGETIVVDGGSGDETFDRAEPADLRLRSERGRAVQMNAGAAAATGDVLVFLHADCRLEPGAFEAMSAALADERAVGGCFRQRIDANGWWYRILERGNGLRARWAKWVYGDQGLFVRRDVFERLGGFPEVPLMEDLLFAKRLRRTGRIAYVRDARIVVSARRWQRSGVLRQTLRNWCLILLAQCGVPPERLARFYPHIR